MDGIREELRGTEIIRSFALSRSHSGERNSREMSLYIRARKYLIIPQDAIMWHLSGTDSLLSVVFFDDLAKGDHTENYARSAGMVLSTK